MLLFVRNLLLANTGTSILLSPEHSLIFVIKCPTLGRCLPQMAPTASHEYLRYLPRMPAAYFGLLNFAASLKKYLSSYS
jgi:hypothetical protein